MVTILPRYKSIEKMCNNTRSVHKSERSDIVKSKHHSCLFKLLKCSPQQLCILCFLFYYFAVGSCMEMNVSSTKQPMTERPGHPQVLSIQCIGENCYMKLPSSKVGLKNMLAASKVLFNEYAETENSAKAVTEEGLEKLMTDIGLIKTDSHEGHDHESHEDHDHSSHEEHDHDSHDGHDHDGHDHGHHEEHEYTAEDSDYFNMFFDYDSDEEENSTLSRRRRSEDELPCIKSVKDLVRSYFSPRPSDKVTLTLGDFMTLMPQLLLDIKRPECRIIKEAEHEDEDTKSRLSIEHSTRNIWLISFGSVTIISIVSLLGVLLIPLLKHSKALNQLIAFLVALAVGTLTGDALLHLLPHSSGLHDHSGEGHEGHNHGSEESEEDHFNMMWKGLVACAGIYVFFLIETIMGMIHRKKSHNNDHHKQHACGVESPSISLPSAQEIKNNKEDITVQYSPTQSPLLNVNGSAANGKVPNGNEINGDAKFFMSSSQAPLITINGTKQATNDEGHNCAIIIDEEPIETGHHHHHHTVPQTVASLAWMVIVGDGLHNITDGLAIGAAFTSSIGAGLGTGLAIFFHEIPQELGDFAILLNSGMTVKQALLWNFISACMCFVGLIIGLVLGEYTSGIILWILAFTAGGFLYIALVDMLPAMQKQLEHKGYVKRFIIQNAGMLLGFVLMIIIALKEDSFNDLF